MLRDLMGVDTEGRPLHTLTERGTRWPVRGRLEHLLILRVVGRLSHQDARMADGVTPERRNVLRVLLNASQGVDELAIGFVYNHDGTYARRRRVNATDAAGRRLGGSDSGSALSALSSSSSSSSAGNPPSPTHRSAPGARKGGNAARAADARGPRDGGEEEEEEEGKKREP
jgi:hypothetical protein